MEALKQLIEDMAATISAQQQKITSLEQAVEFLSYSAALDRQRMTAIEIATNTKIDDGYWSSNEQAELLERFNLQMIEPSSLTESKDDSTIDDQVYFFVIDSFFSTATDIMEKFGLSRPAAIGIMKRVAASHDDLVLSKKPVRPRSRCQQWILERASWNPLSA